LTLDQVAEKRLVRGVADDGTKHLFHRTTNNSLDGVSILGAGQQKDQEGFEW
jgi:hypothetical protein